MKEFSKRLLRRFLAFLMIISVFAVPSVKTVRAEGTGDSLEDPVIMTPGTVYGKQWTEKGQELYNRITVPAQGYITFSIDKPLDYQNYYGFYNISILNWEGTELFRIDSSGLMLESGNSSVYNIGLDAGTYYIKVTVYAKYSTDSVLGRTSYYVNYSYDYTQTDAWETEPNNTENNAMQLPLGQTVTGEFGEEDSYYGDGAIDCFKAMLTKGVTYRFSMQGWNELKETTWYGYIIDENDRFTLNVAETSGSFINGSDRCWEFTAPSTDTYYIWFCNYGMNKQVQYRINLTARLINAWQKLSDGWHYYGADGKSVTGWKKIKGKWYWFDPAGVMITGWKKVSGKWYYFRSSGAMKTGWLKLSGKWYYLDSSGAMVTGTRRIGSKTYRFSSSGVCQNP